MFARGSARYTAGRSNLNSPTEIPEEWPYPAFFPINRFVTDWYCVLFVYVRAVIDNREGGGIGNAYAHIRSLAAHARHGTPP